MAEKKQVAFLPGVRERDIPSLPYEIKTALVERLQAIAAGTEKGARMLPDGPEDILGNTGCRKLYLNRPQTEQRMEDNRRSGRRAGHGINEGGGWRAVYYETTIRNHAAIMVVGVGPRASDQIYEAAEERLRQLEQTRAAQAPQNSDLANLRAVVGRAQQGLAPPGRPSNDAPNTQRVQQHGQRNRGPQTGR